MTDANLLSFFAALAVMSPARYSAMVGKVTAACERIMRNCHTVCATDLVVDAMAYLNSNAAYRFDADTLKTPDTDKRRGADIGTLLYRKATHLAIDAIKRHDNSQTGSGDKGRGEGSEEAGALWDTIRSTAFPPASAMHKRDEVLAVVEAAALNETQESVLFHTAVLGWSYQECSDSLGVKLGTIMSSLWHAKRKCRAIAEGRGVTPAALFGA